MEVNTRRAASSLLCRYCAFAKKDDYIEVTRWANSEGYDIDICAEREHNKVRHITLTCGEIEAIIAAYNALEAE